MSKRKRKHRGQRRQQASITPEDRELAARVTILIEHGRYNEARKAIDSHAPPLDPLLVELVERLRLTVHEIGGIDETTADRLVECGIVTCRDFLDRTEQEIADLGIKRLAFEAVTSRLAELGMRSLRSA